MILPIYNVYPACEKFTLVIVAFNRLRCGYYRHPFLNVLLCRIAPKAEGIQVVFCSLIVAI